MMRFCTIVKLAGVVAFMLLAMHSASAEEQTKLPIPRFVSLKADEANVRTGPGERYPISWIFKRKNVPVEITEEFEHWRKIRDGEGSEGWVLKSLLDGKRYGIIKGKIRTLRRVPEEGATPLLRAKPGVIGRLLECQKTWCRLQIDSRKAWLKKTEFWGVYPAEEWN